MQRIALTVPRDIEAFLNQTIDRFSIGWYWTAAAVFRVWNGVVESRVQPLAGAEVRCRRWWQAEEALCELVFVAPAGKETSAVNAPAVGGTGVRGVLAELMAAKSSLGVLRDGTEGQELEEGRGMSEEEQSRL